MLKVRLFIFFCYFLVSANGQEILQVRKSFYSSPKNRLAHAEILRNHYLDESPDSIYNIGSFLIRTGLEREQLAELNYGKLIISNYYSKHGKPEVSIENLKECVLFYERKRDLEKLADAQNLMGYALMYQEKNKEAISWFLKSLANAQKLPADNESYMAQINMVEAFYRLEQFESAEKELESFIIKVKHQKLNKGLRRAYQLKAKICFATDRVEEGVELSRQSMHLAYENGDKLGLSFAKNDMAIAYFQIGDENSAYQAFESSLTLRKEIGTFSLICESYFNLGEYFYFKEDYPKAISYYDSSHQLAQKNHLLVEDLDALERIGECYFKSNRAKEAYLFMADFALKQKEYIQVLKKDDATIADDLKEFRLDEEKLNQTIRERELQKRIEQADFNTKITFLVSLVVCLLCLIFVRRIKKGKHVTPE